MTEKEYERRLREILTRLENARLNYMAANSLAQTTLQTFEKLKEEYKQLLIFKPVTPSAIEPEPPDKD